MAGAVIALLLVAGVGVVIWKRCDIWPDMCKLDPANDTPAPPPTPEQAKRIAAAPSHGGARLRQAATMQSTGVSQQQAAFAKTLSQHGYRLAI